MIKRASLNAGENFTLNSKLPNTDEQAIEHNTSHVSPKPRSAAAPIHRGARRRGQILNVAERVFTNKGFAETTMQDVASEAGASKETLYRHFGSKKALFAELIEVRTRCIHDRLEVRLAAQGSIESALRYLGTSLVDVLTSAEVVSFSKMISSEAYRNPSIQRLVYSVALGDLVEVLSEYLKAAKRNDKFAGRNPELCARIFLGAFLSFSQFPGFFLNGRTSLTRGEIDSTVDEVVLLFTRAYAALNSSA